MLGIVHIGTEKTGTTSFQTFLHDNRQALLKQGILYPEHLGGKNHRFIASFTLSPDSEDQSIRDLNITTEDEMRRFCSRVENRLRNQIHNAPTAKICILSSEHLHSRLTSIEQIEHVRTLLEPLFDDLEIHVHLRPQIDMLVSLASTRTRVGGAVRREFFNHASNDKLYYNYNSLVAAWEHVFNPERVFCVPFKDNPDFLQYIAARLGIDLSCLPKPKRINEAVDVHVMAMVNTLVDSGSHHRINSRVINRLPIEKKLELGNAFARKIQRRFEESNHILIKRRPDLLPGQLEPQWARYPEQGNLAIIEQPCAFAPALAHLVTYYNTLISDLSGKRENGPDHDGPGG